jgi:hypothetical protein
MGLLNRDQILQANDLPFKDVDVSEWDGTVRVRTMTGGERDSFEASIYKGSGEKIEFDRENIRAKLLARVIVNDKGERLFTDKDVLALSGKSAKPLNKLFDIAQELNGISKEEQEEIKKK